MKAASMNTYRPLIRSGVKITSLEKPFANDHALVQPPPEPAETRRSLPRGLDGLGGKPEKFTHARLDDLAIVRHQSFSGDFVFQVQIELAAPEQVEKKRRHISSVHLAGVIRN